MSNSVIHSMLIEQSAKWLQGKGCAVVITDMTHAGPETADAIGWRGKQSTVIEVKASRADFRADAKKSFRRMPDSGMGCLRYFCALRGDLRPDELPEKWGLLEWTGQKLIETRKPEHRNSNAKEEVSLLLSAIRRIAHDAPKGFSVRCYTMESKNRATLGIQQLETFPTSGN